MQAALADAAAPAVQEALNACTAPSRGDSGPAAVADVSDRDADAVTGAPASARRVPASNFHLTLAFLGSVPPSRLDDVKAAAARCGSPQGSPRRSIDITLDSIDHWRKPQVLVVTASQTPPAAVALAERLKRSLIDAGFSPDLKPFRVHATVARKVRCVTREVRIEPVRWRFESFHLVSSTTAPEGSTYAPIAEWMLQDVDVTE